MRFYYALQNLTKLSKLDLVSWRRGVAQLELDLAEEDAKSHDMVLQAIRRAMTTLPLIINWTVLFIHSEVPKFPFDPKAYQALAALDIAGVRTKFLLLSETGADFEDVILPEETKMLQEARICRAKLEVLCTTSLLHSKMERFRLAGAPSLEAYFKSVATKLIKHPTKISDKVRVRLAEDILIVTKGHLTQFVAPSLSTCQAALVTSRVEDVVENGSNAVMVGSTSILSGVQVEKWHEEVELVGISTQPASHLDPLLTGRNAILLGKGTPYALPDTSKHSKTEEKKNSLRFSLLTRKLSSQSEVLIVWTRWDLYRLYKDGPASRGLTKRFYALMALENGLLLAKELLNAEMVTSPPLPHGGESEKTAPAEEREAELLDLEMNVALDQLPKKDYVAEESSSGVAEALETLIWTSSGKARFKSLV